MSTPADPSIDNSLLETAVPQSEVTGVTESPTSTIIQPPVSRARRFIRKTGWGFLTLFLLLFFTVLKLPDEQIKALIQAQISSGLADMGYTINASSTSFSILTGISYKMKDVNISSMTGTSLHLEELGVSPSLLPLLLMKTGASFWVDTVGGGKIKGSASWSKTKYSVSVKISDLDLKKSGIPQGLAQIAAAGMVNGAASFDGDTNNPMQTDGEAHLNLSKAVVEQQTLVGFSIPKISISEGKVEVTVAKGKAQVKTFTLGKPGNAADDLQGNLSGDIVLGRPLETSNLNLKTKFTVSENILKSFVLFDTFFGAFKQPDGAYQFQITGALGSPNTSPVNP